MSEGRITAAGVGLRKQIREFVLGELALGKGVATVTDDESLVANGVVDSLGIFQLVAFLEESFRIPIGDEEIIQENFLTIEAIERFVVGKLRRSGE